MGETGWRGAGGPGSGRAPAEAASMPACARCCTARLRPAARAAQARPRAPSRPPAHHASKPDAGAPLAHVWAQRHLERAVLGGGVPARAHVELAGAVAWRERGAAGETRGGGERSGDRQVWGGGRDGPRAPVLHRPRHAPAPAPAPARRTRGLLGLEVQVEGGPGAVPSALHRHPNHHLRGGRGVGGVRCRRLRWHGVDGRRGQPAQGCNQLLPGCAPHSLRPLCTCWSPSST